MWAGRRAFQFQSPIGNLESAVFSGLMTMSMEMGHSRSKRSCGAGPEAASARSRPQFLCLYLPLFDSESWKVAFLKQHLPAWKLGILSPSSARVIDGMGDGQHLTVRQGICHGSLSFILPLPCHDRTTRSAFRCRRINLNPSQEGML